MRLKVESVREAAIDFMTTILGQTIIIMARAKAARTSNTKYKHTHTHLHKSSIFIRQLRPFMRFVIDMKRPNDARLKSKAAQWFFCCLRCRSTRTHWMLHRDQHCQHPFQWNSIGQITTIPTNSENENAKKGSNYRFSFVFIAPLHFFCAPFQKQDLFVISFVWNDNVDAANVWINQWSQQETKTNSFFLSREPLCSVCSHNQQMRDKKKKWLHA